MGAWLTEERAEGRNADEAYRIAYNNAIAYNGHQEGYSGAINSKAAGFIKIDLPPRFTYAKLQGLFEQWENIRSNVEYTQDEIESYNWRVRNKHVRATKNEASRLNRNRNRARTARDRFLAKLPASLYNFESLAERYNDKWGQPLCVELPVREAKPSKRGRRVYVFFGYAPS